MVVRAYERNGRTKDIEMKSNYSAARHKGCIDCQVMMIGKEFILCDAQRDRDNEPMLVNYVQPYTCLKMKETEYKNLFITDNELIK